MSRLQNIIDAVRGKEQKSRRKDILKNAGIVLDREIWQLPNGLRLYNAKDMSYILNEIFIDNDYDFESSDEFVIVDIGMNKGTASLFFAAKSFVSDVYGFEPFLETFNVAQENFALNRDKSKKIHSFPFGLSDSVFTIDVPYDINYAGSMSVVNPESNKRYNANLETAKVEIKEAAPEIDAIIQKHSDKKIALKIDTEGSEFAILKNLDDSGLLKKVHVVFIEYHLKSCQELVDRLNENNFVVFYNNGRKDIGNTGVLHAVRML